MSTATDDIPSSWKDAPLQSIVPSILIEPRRNTISSGSYTSSENSKFSHGSTTCENTFLEEPNAKTTKSFHSFLRLPPEIRCIIYGLVLPYQYDTDQTVYPGPNLHRAMLQVARAWTPTPQTNILATSKQVFCEATPMKYANTRFEVSIAAIYTRDFTGYTVQTVMRLSQDEVMIRQHKFARERHFDRPDATGPFSESSNQMAGVPTLEEPISASAKTLFKVRPFKSLTIKLRCRYKDPSESTQETVEFWIRKLAPFAQLHLIQQGTLLTVVGCVAPFQSPIYNRDYGPHNCSQVEKLLQEHFTEKVRPISS
ncbi:MAG: hypothetical protein Q9169_007974 [Polycauliona sp. 2 TL-2023]